RRPRHAFSHRVGDVCRGSSVLDRGVLSPGWEGLAGSLHALCLRGTCVLLDEEQQGWLEPQGDPPGHRRRPQPELVGDLRDHCRPEADPPELVGLRMRVRAGALAAAFLLVFTGSAVAGPQDGLIPLEDYTSATARSLATAHQAELLKLSTQIYHCL